MANEKLPRVLSRFFACPGKGQVAQRQACVELNDNTQRSFGETGGSLSKGRAKSTGQSLFQNWKKQKEVHHQKGMGQQTLLKLSSNKSFA